MNNRFADTLFAVSRYLQFLRKSGNRYNVHSPFLYQAIEQVIRPGAPEAICAPVEDLRNKLLKDRRVIMKTDFGSGRREQPSSPYPVRISHIARHSSLPSKRASRLFYLVRFLKAQNIIEFGTSLGISTAYMANADAMANIVSMEGCPVVAELARLNLSELGVKNVRVIQGNFDEQLPVALKLLKKPDLVFLDGNHRFEPTVRYFHQCLEVAHNDTMFVLDDIHYSKEMEAAWKSVIESPEITASIDLFHQGWIFKKKELSKQHFILNYP